MAFGQQSGSPASAKQIRDLLTLLNDAGHSDFRDARGPMGFTQRQAGGKFSRDEADAFIEQLEQAAHENSTEPPSRPSMRASPRAATTPNAGSAPTPRTSAKERALRDVSSELLAAELQRRGWIVVEP
jgi:hypothetical protein